MEYAPPEIRSPSPTSSVGSRHPEDQTSLSDSEVMLDNFRFEQKWESKIGLGEPTQREIEAAREPLITRPVPGSEAEKEVYKSILRSLRREVQQLHENEIFEQTLLQGSKAALETPVHTRDIDTIMRSMMSPSSSTPLFPSATSTPFAGPSRSFPKLPTYNPSAHAVMTDGPWNDPEVTRGGFGAGMDSFIGTTHGNGMMSAAQGSVRRNKGRR
ncbi:hypothetical protein BDP27DRAFT_1330624 [Rhodocollybia butyracea]|uniref:Uncharacterized protein n=1 Tax=Rhodocollybia butyracea TaxID=206335 RepID=A0A9P5PIT0_9AGAR|nr:hypothetical protein BDP27DRAFT_1330624 [Rhodocollybia butyracea]